MHCYHTYIYCFPLIYISQIYEGNTATPARMGSKMIFKAVALIRNTVLNSLQLPLHMSSISDTSSNKIVLVNVA